MKNLTRCFAWLLMSAVSSYGADLRLIEAVTKNDAKTVRTLIAQRVDVNGSEADGATALHWAAQRDNLEIADVLIAARANVKATTRFNVTPLSLACTNGNATHFGWLRHTAAKSRSSASQSALSSSQ